MISTSDFKAGMVIRYENQMCEIIDYQMVRMQQRQAIFRTKLKNIKTGAVLEQPIRSGEQFEEIYLEDRPIQYLYMDGDKYHFMDSASYNEVVINKNVLGKQTDFLIENTEVIGRYHNEDLILVELPSSVVLEVAQADPGLRGDTAKSGSKLATTTSGATVKVPLFVNTGDKIRVDTRTGQYLERA